MAHLHADLPLEAPSLRFNATPAPFPARTKQNACLIDGLRTDLTVTSFTDKILVTIVQEGCGLGHFVRSLHCRSLYTCTLISAVRSGLTLYPRYTSLSSQQIPLSPTDARSSILILTALTYYLYHISLQQPSWAAVMLI